MTEFYRAFEDKHRGSRELITERLQVYLPFIEPLTDIYPQATALDLGCGRGEWLELLSSHKFNSLGIDIDENMLSACRALKLNVTQAEAEALAYLKQQSNETYALVSAFHVVEHISFDDLKQLVEEAFRVLKPGGLLIMETPNPENIEVATNNFYLDPTHIRPLPQQLLSFIAEFTGFARVKVLRLQEDKALHQKQQLTLSDVITGASPDYAVIAQKQATAEIISQFDQPFSQEYGLSLQQLLESWQINYNDVLARNQQHNKKLMKMEDKMDGVQHIQSLQRQDTEKVMFMTDVLSQRVDTLDKAICETISKSEFVTVADEIKEQIDLVRLKSEQAEIKNNSLQNDVAGLSQHLERAWLLVEKQQETGHEVTKQALDRYAESLKQVHQANTALQLKLTDIEKLQNSLTTLQTEAIQYQREQQDLQAQLDDAKALNNLYCSQLASVKAELADVHTANHNHYTELQATKTELKNLHASNHHHWLLAEQRQQQINALMNSWSWRITWPLRFLLDFFKTPLESFINLVKWPLIWPAKKLIGKMLANPTRAARINNWLMHKLPFVHRHLRQFAIHRGLMKEVHNFSSPFTENCDSSPHRQNQYQKNDQSEEVTSNNEDRDLHCLDNLPGENLSMGVNSSQRSPLEQFIISKRGRS